MTHSFLFSIIIPNYNKADNIRALMSSIFDNYPFDDFELFFMDDASTDSSVIEAQRFPARIFTSEIHLGPATLKNMAAKEARGEYLLFMDSDVIISSETLVNLRNLCLTRKFAALSGLEVLPPVIDNWIGYYRTLQIQDTWGAYRTKETIINAWGTTFGALKRDLFLEIGGFKESYKGADVEDHELAAQIDGGQIVLFSPQLTYRHSYSGTVEMMIKQFRRASQMIRFKQNTLLTHSFYNWKFKVSHLLSAAAIAGVISCLLDWRFIYFVITVLALRGAANYYLLSQALKIKGILFSVYCFIVSLIMSMCAVAGALYGAINRVKK